MLARLFGHITSNTNFLLVIYGTALSTGHFLLVQNQHFRLTTYWGEIEFIPIAGHIIFAFLLLLSMFGAQWMLEYRYHLLKRHAYFPFFLPLFLIMLSSNGEMNLLLMLIFVLLIVGGWLSIYQGEKIIARTLNTGIIVGLGAIFDTRFSILLFFSLLVYAIYGRFSFRSVLILLIGYITIWLDALALEYIFFENTTLYDLFLQTFTVYKEAGFAKVPISASIFMGLFLLLGLIEVPKTLSRASVFKRQSYIIFLLLILSGIMGIFLFELSQFQVAIVIFMASLLFTNYFQYLKKRWMQELIMLLSIGVMALIDLKVI